MHFQSQDVYNTLVNNYKPTFTEVNSKSCYHVIFRLQILSKYHSTLQNNALNKTISYKKSLNNVIKKFASKHCCNGYTCVHPPTHTHTNSKNERNNSDFYILISIYCICSACFPCTEKTCFINAMQVQLITVNKALVKIKFVPFDQF